MESRSVSTTTPMRVLAVIPGNGEGSSMIFARRQVHSLSELGLELRIFFLENRMHPRQVVRAARKLRAIVDGFKPDIVHAHYGTVTSFVCACVTRTPLVITFRGSDLNRHAAVPRVRYLIALALSQLSTLRATRVICVSRQLRGRLWWDRNRATVLPSGVNLTLFKPQPHEDARSVLNWEQQTPAVVFNGGYNPHAKGLALAIESIARAQAKIGRVRLILLDGRIPPERVPVYLNAADCLLVASEREGSPNIVKEAMACNLPVVSVDVGDVAERLAGVEPSTIAPRDPEAMGSALVQILTKRERSNGREKLMECSEEYVAGELLKIYDDITRGECRVRGHSSPIPMSRPDLT